MLVYASSSAAFVQTIFQFLLLEKAGHVIKEILTVIYWYRSTEVGSIHAFCILFTSS